ncbi:ABC transporter substrate-binding protein [Treponema sp. OMZ 792]|uniref:ABC transporter substrate-binding protein n=1 Tax=unclassified Treponema TaxID=2638727 RepID=UPI0020A5D41C|nr:MULTISPECIES: MqnA/MqnD/SBP family protein [unclassified Treponema]UTC74940.1 ABC transporter substrate-binding protein [Treponema sp. OMZ 792]UTC81334.1 ABC transporter substrate-binding protein [Treponema sp. OMZ 798]
MKKMYLKFFLLFVCFGVLFAGGTKEKLEKDNFNVKVVMPSGAPAVTLSKLVYEKMQFDNSKTEYEVLSGPELLQARVLSGEADIAIVPTNLASVLYSKQKNIKLLAPIIWGNLYVISSETISSVSDLKGKTLYSFGRNNAPDLTVREVLKKNGIDPDKDVSFEYVAAASDIPPAFISGKAKFAVSAEPSLSMIMTKKPGTKVIADIQAEWKKFFDGASYPQASLIVNSEFAKKHPEYVKAFLDKAKESSEWVNTNPQKAAEYASQIATLPPPPILSKAIPKLNIAFVEVEKARPAVEAYLKVLAETNPKFIGGSLPDDAFYYKAK